jgi:diaminobutyrate-2-oxoglutarate transaminase
LRQYWSDDALQTEVKYLGQRAYEGLSQIAQRHGDSCGAVRGRGLLLALPFIMPGLAKQVSRAAFERGLLVETAGPCNEVVKILPPLNIDEGELITGLNILSESVDDVLTTTH